MLPRRQQLDHKRPPTRISKRIRISWNDTREDEIVGVVGDVRHQGLDAAPRSMTHWPHARFASGVMSLALRTTW